MNSRAKGKRGELEAAAMIREHGYEARRGQQYSGGGDSPDVVGLPGIHVECKWTECLNLYGAVDQASRDSAGSGNVPIVLHKRNRREPVVIELWSTWIERYKRT